MENLAQKEPLIFLTIFFTFLLFGFIGSAILIIKAIKRLIILIRYRFDPQFRQEYDFKINHENMKYEFEIYYSKVSKRKYKNHEYIKKILDKYEPWRNPKE